MTMSLQSDPPADDAQGHDSRRWLSAAADGDAQAFDQACRAWRDEASARATWHAYHLIGDVLRSGELATSPGRDAAFVQALRRKLAAEPVVLAPQARPPGTLAAAARRASAAWLLPAAVAAGFVVVAGVLVVSRSSNPAGPASAETLAAASSPMAVTRVSNGGLPPPSPSPGDSMLLRDARLDEYLRAHQAARGGLAVAAPASALRRVDAELPAGAQR